MHSPLCIHKTPIVPRFFALYREPKFFSRVNIHATLSQFPRVSFPQEIRFVFILTTMPKIFPTRRKFSTAWSFMPLDLLCHLCPCHLSFGSVRDVLFGSGLPRCVHSWFLPLPTPSLSLAASALQREQFLHATPSPTFPSL